MENIIKRKEYSIGFTGTQIGMTGPQKRTFETIFDTRFKSHLIHFHHGDCIGADAEAHEIARQYGTSVKIHIHPPINDSKRAFKKGDTYYEAKEYLDRNHDIVNSSDILIGTPRSQEEELRSGTWATLRYAKKNGKKYVIIYPDGQVGEQI
jgi:hypothetical protein